MKEKKSGGALLGAAFLMATSAIGPGFLTQTAQFTGTHKGSFGFVILVSIILSAIAQINIWRVLCVSYASYYVYADWEEGDHQFDVSQKVYNEIQEGDCMQVCRRHSIFGLHYWILHNDKACKWGVP